MAKRKFRRKIEVVEDDAAVEPKSAGKTVDESAEDNPELDAEVSAAEDQLHEGAADENLAEESAAGDTAEMNPQEVKIAELAKEAEENWNKYLRSVAEFENYKKRTLKERADLIRYAGEHLAHDLLEVFDDLKRASQQEVNPGGEEILEGVQLILNRFEQVLGQHSVVAESALEKPFDPEKHEAIATVPTTEHKPGTVMEEFKRAFFFKDKLIRPAQVVVSKEPEADKSE